MRANFVDLLRESTSLLDFDLTCVGVLQKYVNIKKAITMTATMTPCSNAILDEKSILLILHLRI